MPVFKSSFRNRAVRHESHGGRETKKSFTRVGPPRGPRPLPFYVPLLTEKVALQYAFTGHTKGPQEKFYPKNSQIVNLKPPKASAPTHHLYTCTRYFERPFLKHLNTNFLILFYTSTPENSTFSYSSSLKKDPTWSKPSGKSGRIVLWNAGP